MGRRREGVEDRENGRRLGCVVPVVLTTLSRSEGAGPPPQTSKHWSARFEQGEVDLTVGNE